MEYDRRQATRLLGLGAAGALCAAGEARAETYPDRVIRIVNPFPVGISTDVLGRGLSQKLTELLGQSVIVESKPGANGIIATTNVARSAPDGYTMLITTGSHTANPLVSKDAGYDPVRDFAPVTQIAGSYGLALISNLPVSSVEALVALAKSKPLTYAVQGLGNLTHVSGRLFEERSGLKMTAVPYNTPNLITDVIAGTVDMTFISTVSAVPLVTGGKVKALAITGPKRSPGLPDTPTLTELGYRDFVLTGFFGTLFPAGTPRERVDRIYRETARTLATGEMKRLVEDAGLFVVGSTPDEFAAFLKADYDYQSRILGELGLRAA